MKNKKTISRILSAIFITGLLCITSTQGMTQISITSTKEIINTYTPLQNIETTSTNQPKLYEKEENCGCDKYENSLYPIMHPNEEMFDEWLNEYYESIEKQSLINQSTPNSDQDIIARSHFDLLDHIWYCPENRSQGNCGNCWAWASTGCMEVELCKDWGIIDRLSIQWVNSVFLDGNLTGLGEWACCGRSATTFADFYTTNTTIAIPWNNTNGDHIDEPVGCSGHTLQDQANIATYPYYQINSINAYGLPTYGLPQDQAINNIKSKLSEDKALYYWFALPTASDWDDPPNGFRYFWDNFDENTLWSPDFAQGHQWIDGEGGGHGVLCVGWDETDPNNPYWIMINSWSTTPGRPNGIWHLDMNTNYSTWFWDSAHQNHKQAQGFEYFEIDFGISAHEPIVNAGGAYAQDEGSMITFTAVGSDDDGDALQYRWDFENDGIYDTDWSSSNSTTHTWYDDYIGIVKVQICDGQRTSTDTAIVVINNVAPTADFDNDSPTDEGSPVTISFSNQYDPGIYDTFTYSFDLDNNGIYEIVDQQDPITTYTWGDDGSYTIKGKIKDDDNGFTEYLSTVVINNVPPTITDLFLDQPNQQFILPHIHNLTFIGNFTDLGWLDTHSGTWYFGDGSSMPGIVIEENIEPDATGNITGYHSYDIPGNYTVTLILFDDDGGSDNQTMQIEVVDEFGALQDLDDYIQNLSDDAFKGNPNQRKKALGNKIDAVRHMLEIYEYQEAIDKLHNDIRAKADGFIDGNPKNDWIINPIAQFHICMKIDDITAYLEYLIPQKKIE
jgi:hypothetical protein